MRVLVTGAAGFIGGHLARALGSDGHEVTVFDRRPMTDEFLEGPGQYRVVVGDLRDPMAVETAVSEVDAVVHLAAETNARAESASERKEMMSTNVVGTDLLLNAMGHAKVPRMVFASSAAVYRPDSQAMEPTAPKNISTAYALSKNLGEMMVTGGRVDCSAVLRFANVYGVGGNGVVNRWMEKVLAGEGIEIYGDGRQVRDYVHVDDVVRAIKKALTAEDGLVENVSTGVGTSLADLALEVMAAVPGAGKRGVPMYRREAVRNDVPYSVLIRGDWLNRDWLETPLKDGLRKLAKELAKE